MVRRVSGVSVGTYLRNEIAGPLDAEFFIGLPASEEPRVARLVSFLEGLGAADGPLEQSGDLAAGGGTGLAELAELAPTYLAPDGPLFKALVAPGGAFSDQEVWHEPAAARGRDPGRQRHL